MKSLFYFTDEELENSPSRKDGIDSHTEKQLRNYGCELIQEAGILLKLPQPVPATGQVLFHRFYCKKSFADFNVKRVAASCLWLASKHEENPRKARQIITVFHRLECIRKENVTSPELDDQKHMDLKSDLVRTELHVLREMGFFCHVEHPYKLMFCYLSVLQAPAEVRQEAWLLLSDSFRTTLCLRFKEEAVACGIISAAARRCQFPLPENPPWWDVFDAEKSHIHEVCRVLEWLYGLPKPEYIPAGQDEGLRSPTLDSSAQEGGRSSPLIQAPLSSTKEDNNRVKHPRDRGGHPWRNYNYKEGRHGFSKHDFSRASDHDHRRHSSREEKRPRRHHPRHSYSYSSREEKRFRHH